MKLFLCFLLIISSKAFTTRNLAPSKQMLPRLFETLQPGQSYRMDHGQKLDPAIMQKFDEITIFLSRNIRKIEHLGNDLVSCLKEEKETILKDLTEKYAERKDVLASLDHFDDQTLELYIKLQLNKIQQRDQEITHMIEDCHSFGCDFEADQYFSLREEQSLVLGPLAVYKEVLKNRRSVLGHVSSYDKHTPNL